MDVNLGIGSIKFAMTEDELVSILGHSDEMGEFSYVEGIDDWYKEYGYYHSNLTFTFDSSDDFRLGCVDIIGSGHHLFGQDIFGLNIKWAKMYLLQKIGPEPEPEYANTTWGNLSYMNY